MRTLPRLASSILFLPALWSQDFRASLTGLITDASGAVVSGARVKATHSQTNAATEAVSNESGRYSIAFLIPGRYTVEVEAPGFKKSVRENVELQISVRAALDITLELGALTERVTVSERISLLETETASRGGIGPAAIRPARLPPSRNSRARNGNPSRLPTWNTCTMLGWLRAAAARASASNRPSSSGLDSAPCGSIFRATVRLSRTSRAR